MERKIITISESGIVNIPYNNVWMSEIELVELFGVITPTLRATIKAIYKSEALNPATTQQDEVIALAVGLHSTILTWSLLLHLG